jgi:predicted lipase
LQKENTVNEAEAKKYADNEENDRYAHRTAVERLDEAHEELLGEIQQGLII